MRTATGFFAWLGLLMMGQTAWGSTFQDWQSEFSSSQMPSSQTIAGYWSGRCVAHHDPDTQTAAIYAYKSLSDDDDDTNYDSQSFYTDRDGDPAQFDALTLDQLAADPKLKTWQDQDPWPAVHQSQGSLTNHYCPDDGTDWIRSARTQVHDGKPTIYLRVADCDRNRPRYYCRFCVPITNPPPTPPNLIGDTGASDGGIITVENKNPARPFTAVQMANEGVGQIRINDIRIHLTNGSWLLLPDTLTLDTGASQAVPFSDAAEALTEVRFFLYGPTTNVRVQGVGILNVLSRQLARQLDVP